MNASTSYPLLIALPRKTLVFLITCPMRRPCSLTTRNLSVHGGNSVGPRMYSSCGRGRQRVSMVMSTAVHGGCVRNMPSQVEDDPCGCNGEVCQAPLLSIRCSVIQTTYSSKICKRTKKKLSCTGRDCVEAECPKERARGRELSDDGDAVRVARPVHVELCGLGYARSISSRDASGRSQEELLSKEAMSRLQLSAISCAPYVRRVS